MKTDDIRITSYVLDELEGEARKTFERELAGSADLQQAVQETAKLRDLLNIMPPTTEELTTEQRKSLREQCLQNVRIAKKSHFNTTALIGVLAAAACVIFAFLISTEGLKKAAPIAQGSLAMEKEHTGSKVVTDSKSASALTTEELKRVDRNIAELKLKATSENLMVFNGSSASQPQSANKEFVTDGVPPKTVSASEILTSTSTSPSTPISGGASGLGRQGSRANSVSEGMAGRKLDATPIVGDIPLHGRAFIGKSGGRIVSSAASQKTGNIDLSASLVGGVQRSSGAGMKSMDMLKKSGFSDKLTDESYDVIKENDFLMARTNPLSTFSTDVDTASYSNVRRLIQAGRIPPSDAVRTEELLNYFTYSYPQPEGNVPFSVNLETARAPWNDKHLLVRIGLKGRELAVKDRPACNLVFLMDVSGSMSPQERLPLLIRCMTTLVENLSPKDHVAIVVYAGSSGIVLPSTSCKDKKTIIEALSRLHAGGSTNGAEGIKLAYDVVCVNFIKDGNNRVILCTDGDFNVGITSREELDKLIERERTSGVFLSLLGVGTDNLKDATMSHLADKGNGNYAYIDSYAEGRKVLVQQMTGTLFTIAKDVKIQVEFNPAQVAGYRLIGYEKRLLAKEDFNNDKKDAGEIGAGHTVTALYEIVPVGQPVPNEPSVDALKYQKPGPAPEQEVTGKNINELMTVKLRYKEPDGDISKLIQQTVSVNDPVDFSKASTDFQFASAVAAFGMKLRNSPYHGDLTWRNIQQIARKNMGEDPGSYRAEFLTLIEKLHQLQEPAEGVEQKDK